MNDDMYQDDEEAEGEGDQQQQHHQLNNRSLNLSTANFDKLYNNWSSSRIIRVSRASGGKDRHSKVLTSKGLRDRRVRLSVSTAVQFYDLQDRLGFDQPSKAVEWLLKAASSSIEELPRINSPFFTDAHNNNSDDQKSSSKNDKAPDVDMDVVSNGTENNCVVMGGSGLSLSRSESRVRARERAKERVLKEKKEDVNNGSNEYLDQLNPNIMSRATSFTELLSGGMNNVVVDNNNNHNKQWDNYFTSSHGLMEQNTQFTISSSRFSGENSPEIRHLSSKFLPDLLVTAGNGNTNEYNLINFAISSSTNSSSASGDNNNSSSSSLGLTGFNGGTLQSNSSSLSHHYQSFMPQYQRFNYSQDGSSCDSQGFFNDCGGSMPVDNNNINNHHQFVSGFDSRLNLCCGNNNTHDASHGNHKVKRKNI